MSTIETENLCGLKRKDFQTTINGKKTDLYILRNRLGYEVAITNYGGAIVAIMVPDKDGKVANVIHGHDNIQDVINSPEPYLSTLIGRYGNRICRGQFTLNGKEYTLCSEKDGEFKTVSQSVLVPLVSAADKADKTDVVVNATNVLRGLQQSVFIASTMDKIQKSAEKCAALKSGYVNMGDKKSEKWVRVAKLVNGSWAIAAEEKKVASNAQKAAAGTKKSSTKKSSRKAA